MSARPARSLAVCLESLYDPANRVLSHSGLPGSPKLWGLGCRAIALKPGSPLPLSNRVSIAQVHTAALGSSPAS